MVLGVLLMAVGIAGLVLPILPGWIFLVIGLSMVAPQYAAGFRRKLQQKFFKQDTIRFQEWRKKGVIAGFTTKHFPLLLKKTDELLNLSNQNAFRELLWKSHVLMESEKASLNRFAFLNQVHGSEIVVLEDAKLYDKEGFYHFLKADAVITDIPRLTLLTLSADCLTIFFLVKGRGKKADWVGLAHAGWRGTAEKIAAKTVAKLIERSGCRPSDVQVAFGPCISAPNYEVRPEFKQHFKGRSLTIKKDKLHFDLAGENARQLLEAGVWSWNILDSKICTIGQNAHFYSFRKEKEDAGRMISFITKL
jgi:YfiH family protein